MMLVARRRERRLIGDEDGLWPPFWIATCGLLLAMALGRAFEAGGLVATFGRRAAEGGDWYASRRPIQAVVIVGLVAAWCVVVIVALWRTPERRRRYLPVGLASLTLVAFAGVRVVSLHQVDSLVYRTDLAGVRVGTITEIALLVVTGLATRWCPPAARRHDQIRHPDRAPVPDSGFGPVRPSSDGASSHQDHADGP
jgi:hypothetical protein